MREVAALSLAGLVCAAAGGAIFRVAHGGTPLTRSIAYGCWIAAAVALVLMALNGSKRLTRALDVPSVEGWLFVAASIVLTAAGIVVDLLGSR